MKSKLINEISSNYVKTVNNFECFLYLSINIPNIYADKITWSFTGEYEIKTVEDIKMPEATVSDKTIDVLKSLYSSYLEIIKKS